MGTRMQSLGFPRSSANVSPVDRPAGSPADPGNPAVPGAGTANQPPVESSSSAERLISPRRVQAQPSASTTGRRAASLGAGATATVSQPSPPSLRSPASGSDVSRGVPPAKRPKGRWFISSCLALLFLAVGYSLWNELWHYQAHGVVDARIVQLAAPAAARVASVHAREGQEVRMGDLLVTLDRPELLQQIDRTRDELRVALAAVAAETIRASREDEAQVARQRGSLADYFRFRTQLIEAETSWQERSDEFARQRGLVARGAAAAADVDRLSTQMSGLQETIDQLREAIDGLQPDPSPAGQQPAIDPMVGPQLAHVDELRRELGRLREQLSLCELRAPCDGLVVRQHHYSGETVAAAEPIVELAEQGSEHIALYVPQRLATKLQIGSEVNLNIVALRNQLPCHVWRFDPALQPAPAGLARYYNQHERLVVVRLMPDLRSASDAVWQGVWLGSHVRWPRSWDNPWGAPTRVAEPGASRLSAAAPEGWGQ